MRRSTRTTRAAPGKRAGAASAAAAARWRPLERQRPVASSLTSTVAAAALDGAHTASKMDDAASGLPHGAGK